MQIRVLGPVDVVDDEGNNVALGGPTQVRMLAMLVAVAPQSLAIDALVSQLWPGEDVPDNPIGTVRTYVARLRRSLGAEAIVTAPGAYRLGLIETDAVRFVDLLERARRMSGSPTVSDVWGQALDLWRGPAFGDLADLESVQPEAVRLDELRAEATEALFDARLASGEGRELTAAVETAVNQFPGREGFRAQQMTALARAGRQPDALRAFQQFRAELTQVGLEPSKRLVELDSQIARGEVPRSGARRTLRGYEIGDRLGEGAFAQVWAATQSSVGREVAIKQIRASLADQPEFIRQFEAEAQLVARLEHPHIVPLYDFWREPGSAYLVMRYLDGGSLANILMDGPLELDRVVAIAGQVAAALNAAQEAGVIHRDVKPGNILLDRAGNAYLSDFGIAVEEAERLDPQAWLSNGSPAYAPPEQLERRPVGPTADIYALAVTVYEALTGNLPFPAEMTIAGLLQRQLNDPIPLVRATRPDTPAAVDTVIQKATAKNPADRYQTAPAFVANLAAAAGLHGDETLITPEDRNPYKGMEAFTEADAGDFTGRERLVNRLIETLTTHRVTAVVGPSGSGKSSVVRAGLVPAIRGGRIPGSDQWFITTMIPGTDPFADLETALLSIAVDPPADFNHLLNANTKGLTRVLRHIMPKDRQLVLIVDQFEELFTLTDTQRSNHFLDTLTDALAADRQQLHLVVTLRADFYDRPLRHPRFAALLEEVTVTVPPLAADELERAIVEPAAAVGARFEPGLVAQITADVADQPGALPLLQYTLTELFDHHADHSLTLESYTRLGGISGSIARRADDLFEHSNEAEQPAIQEIFTRLVTLGEGTEDTRRRVDRSELNHDPATTAVIERYGQARLLSFDRNPATREQTVEVAHEALIRHWPRLRTWIDQNREGLRIHRHLTDTSTAWHTRGQDPGDLYRAGRLETTTEWADRQKAKLNPTERDFLAASRVALQVEQTAERQRVRRLRGLLGVTAVIAVIAVIAGGVAMVQQSRASDAAELADSRRQDAEAAQGEAELARSAEADQRRAAELSALISQSGAEASTRPELSLLLAVKAYDESSGSLASQGALLNALGAAPPRVGSYDTGLSGELFFCAVLADGTLIAPTAENMPVVVSMAADRFSAAERPLGAGQPNPCEGALSPDGRRLAVTDGQQVSILDATTGDELAVHRAATSLAQPGRLPISTTLQGQLVWVREGTELAVLTENGLEYINPETGKLLRTVTYARPTTTAEVLPSGDVAIQLDADPETGLYEIQVLDGDTGSAFYVEQGNEVYLDVTFDRRSSHLSFWGFDAHHIVDPTGEQPPIDVRPKEGFGPAAFGADGRRFYVHQETGIVAYDLATGARLSVLAPLFERSFQLEVTDGGQVVTFTESGTIEVYDQFSAGNAIRSIGFNREDAVDGTPSADGRRIGIIAGLGPTFRYESIDVETGERHTIRPSEIVESDGIVTVGPAARLGMSRGEAVIVEQTLKITRVTADGVIDAEFDLWPQGAAQTAGFIVLAHGQLVVGITTDPNAESDVNTILRTPEFVQVYDAATLVPIGAPVDVGALPAAVTAVAPHPDGSLFLFEESGAVYLASLDGSISQMPVDFGDAVTAAVIDDNGTRMAAVIADGQVRITDLTQMQLGPPLPELPGVQTRLSFTEDGGGLILIDGQARLLLYDIDAGQQVGFLLGEQSGSIFGRATVTEHGTVWVAQGESWLEVPLDPASWRQRACDLAGRNLSPQEWIEFIPADFEYTMICDDWPLVAG